MYGLDRQAQSVLEYDLMIARGNDPRGHAQTNILSLYPKGCGAVGHTFQRDRLHQASQSLHSVVHSRQHIFLGEINRIHPLGQV